MAFVNQQQLFCRSPVNLTFDPGVQVVFDVKVFSRETPVHVLILTPAGSQPDPDAASFHLVTSVPVVLFFNVHISPHLCIY